MLLESDLSTFSNTLASLIKKAKSEIDRAEKLEEILRKQVADDVSDRFVLSISVTNLGDKAASVDPDFDLWFKSDKAKYRAGGSLFQMTDNGYARVKQPVAIDPRRTLDFLLVTSTKTNEVLSAIDIVRPTDGSASMFGRADIYGTRYFTQAFTTEYPVRLPAIEPVKEDEIVVPECVG